MKRLYVCDSSYSWNISLYDCYEWWQNYITTHHGDGTGIKDLSVLVNTTAIFHSKNKNSQSPAFIEFETDEDALHFILTWS